MFKKGTTQVKSDTKDAVSPIQPIPQPDMPTTPAYENVSFLVSTCLLGLGFLLCIPVSALFVCFWNMVWVIVHAFSEHNLRMYMMMKMNTCVICTHVTFFLIHSCTQDVFVCMCYQWVCLFLWLLVYFIYAPTQLLFPLFLYCYGTFGSL